jgi:Bacterial Ig-like domain (group 1)/Galactose oxidase, central domain
MRTFVAAFALVLLGCPSQIEVRCENSSQCFREMPFCSTKGFCAKDSDTPIGGGTAAGGGNNQAGGGDAGGAQAGGAQAGGGDAGGAQAGGGDAGGAQAGGAQAGGSADGGTTVQITVSAEPGTLVADGVAASSVKLTLVDIAGPVVGKPVTVTAAPTAGTTVSTPSGNTMAGGEWVTAVSSTVAGIKTITGTFGVQVAKATITFIPGPLSTATSMIAAVPPVVPADGTSFCTTTVIARDAQGNVLAMQPALFSISGVENVLTTPAITGANGAVTATLRSTGFGMKTVNVTIGGGTLTTSVEFLRVPLWRPSKATGPLPRSSPAMAFNPKTGKTMLFGGVSGTTVFDDTWEWDGVKWTFVNTPGPSARFGAVMAFDSKRDTMILYGGSLSTGTPFTDMWEFDGTIWKKRSFSSINAPKARTSASLTYDTNRSLLVMFGGVSLGVDLRETFTLGSTATGWSTETTPVGVTRAPIAYDNLNAAVALFGGFNGITNMTSNETWKLTSSGWNKLSTSGTPPARFFHEMVFDTDRKQLVVFGGQVDVPSVKTVGETWELKGTAWKETSPAVSPPERYAHGMAYDPDRRVVVIFGGISSKGSLLGDTWEYDAP